MSNPNHTIYLAGGCLGCWVFLSCQVYLMRFRVMPNGSSRDDSLWTIGQTGHAETVQVTYDASKVSLREILLHYFHHQSLSKNKQGNDVRLSTIAGVYYTIKWLANYRTFQEMTEQYGVLAVELLPLKHFIPAEGLPSRLSQKNLMCAMC